MGNYDVIVVGAGAAGLLAAGRAAELGNKVLILEKMHSAGRKLLITGKGRCNITNNDSAKDFIRQVHPKGNFLKQSFSQFFSQDIISLLNRYGVEITLERGGRYFPSSNRSADVVNSLLKWINKRNVQILCNHRIDKLLIENKNIRGVRSNGKDFFAERVILATGGNSYPATGSSGDGYELACQAGHSIEKIRPALVPLETKEEIPRKLQDLALKNINVSVWVNNRKEEEEFGEITFTDFGLSGPVILTLSRIVVDALHEKNKVEISIDLKPALDEKKLDRRLLRELDEHGKKDFGNIFSSLLPAQIIPYFIDHSEVDPEKKCHQVSSRERKRIRYLFKNLRFRISGHRSFKEAIITAGGVSTNEINAGTMESKLVKGLFFAGELIDLDANTGGYNLQIAFSTGWLAGNS